jgi:hypothetical protein
MKILIMAFLSMATMAFSQNDYDSWANTADSLYKAKNYLASAKAFSKAFQTLSWRAAPEHRYAAASSWALANVPDSALSQLVKLAEESKFEELTRLQTDVNFKSLKKDARWNKLILDVTANKKQGDRIRKNPLAQKLEKIYDEDQNLRALSGPMDWKKIMKVDSLNQIEVEKILDTNGWLGEDEIGRKANSALFLVVQHASLPLQLKYLPVMRKAVEDKKARMADLALLEDRVLMRQGKKQIYGSQIVNDKDGKQIVHPIEDAANVDERRRKIGLMPMSEYANIFGLKWNLEEHLKQQKEK